MNQKHQQEGRKHLPAGQLVSRPGAGSLTLLSLITVRSVVPTQRELVGAVRG